MKLMSWSKCLVTLVMLIAAQQVLQAQQAPDTILYNGKILTMDNKEVNANLGTVVQAVAVKDGKIAAVGTNDQIRGMAGPNTKSYDLKGRMASPGFGATHDHPQDWDPLNPYIVRKVVSDDVIVERFLWEEPPNEKIEKFPAVLNEALSKAKPGQWVRISLLFGKEYKWRVETTAILGSQITKKMLDTAAPNNPVIVRAGFVGMVMNQKAVDETKKFYGDQWAKFVNSPLQGYGGGADAAVTGYCAVCYREVEQDVMYPEKQLTEIYRLGLSWMGGYGVTVNGTSLYTGGAIRAYNNIDRANQMSIRLSWGWFWPERNDFFQDPYFSNALATLEGRGSDYLFFGGMTPHQADNCSKLPGTTPEVKQKEAQCAFDDPIIYRAFYEYVKAGGRLMGDHIMADGEIDIVLDIIEKASKDRGMTVEQIREKRHVTEHMAMYPRPDQIPRYKNLGVMSSGWDLYIWEKSGDRILKDYGEQGAMNVVPRKALFDAGVMNSVEIDRPIGYTDITYFQVLHTGITRKDQDGKIYAVKNAISREQMLKSAITFAAYGVKKENVIGSLEPGKFADIVVLDKDYLTIPVDDIPKLRVLMTMVSGKTIHMVPSLAREWGLQPTGAQVELGGPAAQW